MIFFIYLKDKKDDDYLASFDPIRVFSYLILSNLSSVLAFAYHLPPNPMLSWPPFL